MAVDSMISTRDLTNVNEVFKFQANVVFDNLIEIFASPKQKTFCLL